MATVSREAVVLDTGTELRLGKAVDCDVIILEQPVMAFIVGDPIDGSLPVVLDGSDPTIPLFLALPEKKS